MKTLFLSPWNPYPPVFGARLRVLSLLWALAAHAQREVHLLCFGEPGDDLEQSRRQLAGLGIRAHFVPHHAARVSRLGELPTRAAAMLRGVPFNAQLCRPPALTRSLSALLSEHDFGLVVAETSWMGQHVAALRGVPKLLSWQNVDFEVYARRAHADTNPLVRGLRRYNYRVARRFELALVPRFDALLTVSDADRRALLQHGELATPVHVVPICVDTRSLSAAGAAARAAGQILFVGAMFYEPNVDAVRFFHREIFGRVKELVPGARLLIVGRDPVESVRRLAREDGTVQVTGTVADVGSYYHESCVFVAPVRYGGGMKTKIVEAMAAGVPVVASSFAMEGIAARDGEHAWISDDPRVFAQRVARLLQDEGERERLAGAARALVEERYSLDALARTLDRIVAQPAPRP